MRFLCILSATAEAVTGGHGGGVDVGSRQNVLFNCTGRGRPLCFIFPRLFPLSLSSLNSQSDVSHRNKVEFQSSLRKSKFI